MRDLEHRSILISRIIRKRNYGLNKQIEEYSLKIYKAVFNKEEIESATKYLYDSASQGKNIEKLRKESLLSMFFGLNARLDSLSKYLKTWAKSALILGSKKIFDARGNEFKFDIPKYEREIQILAADNMSLVKGLTDDQRKILTQEVIDGIKNGQSFTATAQNIIDKIKDMSMTRAVTIAKNETLKAHSYAQAKTMTENGIKRYQWLTADDNRVAPLDRSMHRKVFEFGHDDEFIDWKGADGKTYQIRASPLPVRDTHINCRCVIICLRDTE